ncbi:Hypothetical protein VCSRO186_0024 [Vibrio cholerae]|nr:hypothetical protein [Vibrio fluvialis]GIB26215.1 Hypothetical protein VCSRO186_0024 [Vibrio cholerae]
MNKHPPSLRRTLSVLLLQVITKGGHYLHAQYQKARDEVKEHSDHDLLELVRSCSSTQALRWAAVRELLSRGYLLKEIRQAMQ